MTRGAGFIDSNFVNYVVDNDPFIKITVFDKLTYADNRQNLPGIPKDRVSIVDAELINQLV